jgi:hypothetical protein
LNLRPLGYEEVADVTTFAAAGDPTAASTPFWPRFTLGPEQVMSLQPAGDSEIVTATEMSAQHDCGVSGRRWAG